MKYQNVDNIPSLKLATLDIPKEECRCWYIDTLNLHIKTVMNCAHVKLSSAEFMEGLYKDTEEAQVQFWTSRMALRQALSSYTDNACRPAEWILTRLPSGKLALENDIAKQLDLDFSISHAEGMTFCAVTQGRAVGIDAELMDRQINPELINSLYYSEDELKVVRQANQAPMSVKLWTLKQASAKTIGLGLSENFSNLEFELTNGSGVNVSKLPAAQQSVKLKLRQFDYQDRYFLSVGTACR